MNIMSDCLFLYINGSGYDLGQNTNI